jgi:hypothetical protein
VATNRLTLVLEHLRRSALRKEGTEQTGGQPHRQPFPTPWRETPFPQPLARSEFAAPFSCHRAEFPRALRGLSRGARKGARNLFLPKKVPCTLSCHPKDRRMAGELTAAGQRLLERLRLLPVQARRLLCMIVR